MSTRAMAKATEKKLTVEAVSRRPQQGRSKASLERMMAAAQKLMIERGNEDFTLQDVSQSGNVSIGSIYLRFESKDNLVRAVIADYLQVMNQEQEILIENLRNATTNLETFVPQFVAAFAEFLKEHSPLLRISMRRASYDLQVSEPGKQSAKHAEVLCTEAMLAHRSEFGGDDNERKANAAYQIIFATLARELSLGSTGELAYRHDWADLKIELGRMCLAYLTSKL